MVLLLTVLVRLKSNCQVIGLVLRHSLKLEECLEIKATSVRIPFQHKDFHVCLQCLFSFCALVDTAYYGEGEQMAVDCFPTGLPQWTLVSSCGTHNLSSHRLSVRKQNEIKNCQSYCKGHTYLQLNINYERSCLNLIYVHNWNDIMSSHPNL